MITSAASSGARPSVAQTPPAPSDEGRRPSTGTRLLEAFAGRYRMVPVLVTLVVIWAFFTSQTTAFLSARNLSNLSVQIVFTSILALGLVLVLIVGEIDLSVAALGAFSTAVMARLLSAAAVPEGLAIILALLTGVLIGVAQGSIVTKFRAPAFIVTLGSSLILQGLLLQVLPRTGQIPLAGTFVDTLGNTYLVRPVGIALGAVTVAGVFVVAHLTHRAARRSGHPTPYARSVVLPTAVAGLATAAAVFVLNAHRGVPGAVVLMLSLLAIMGYVTTQTRFGTYLYAIGGSTEAARRAGIKVRSVKVATFALAGGFAAIAGLMAASRTLGVSSQSGGGTLLLEAVAAAVIGGASLFGGRGSVWAALVGALVIGSISNGLDLIGASAQSKLVVQGLILILAVAVDGALSRSRRAG